MSDCQEEDSEDDVPQSRAEASLSYLAKLDALQVLYLSNSHQFLSRGPKIAAFRKALRGKQLGGWGLNQLLAWNKCLCLWETLKMYTLHFARPGWGVGLGTTPGHLRPRLL